MRRLPAGPNVLDSDAIIIVEGRADVLNLLRYGIKNAVAVEGTHVPRTVEELCEKKTATAFFDGDRGGELILRETPSGGRYRFCCVFSERKKRGRYDQKGGHQDPPEQSAG